MPSRCSKSLIDSPTWRRLAVSCRQPELACQNCETTLKQHLPAPPQPSDDSCPSSHSTGTSLETWSQNFPAKPHPIPAPQRHLILVTKVRAVVILGVALMGRETCTYSALTDFSKQVVFVILPPAMYECSKWSALHFVGSVTVSSSCCSAFS